MSFVFLFDVDGTLVDTSEAHLDAWEDAMAEMGEVFDRKITRSLFGQGTPEIARILLPGRPLVKIEALLKRKEELYRVKHIFKARPIPGAFELLQNLSIRGQRIALATGATREELACYLDLLEVHDLIEAAVCLEDCSRSKPDPEVFLKAQEKMEASREKCIVVGDSPYDMQAAQAGEFVSIGVETGGFDAPTLLAAGAARVYRNVGKMRESLGVQESGSLGVGKAFTSSGLLDS